MFEKPPLDIMPRAIWLENRAKAIEAAIDERFCLWSVIPMEWIEEYNELIEMLQTIDKNGN